MADASSQPDSPPVSAQLPEFQSEPQAPPQALERTEPRLLGSVVQAGAAILIALTLGRILVPAPAEKPTDPAWDSIPAPLVMQGGDPHIRALMRTISAAESNSYRPCSLLYGGEHFDDLSRHPDYCVPIVAGPNVGDCTTAAGRYQFITTTWLERAAHYFPKPAYFWAAKQFSFEPEFQDEVVYRWLSDPEAWGVDLSQLLKQDRLTEVLQILSPTWTSLGYGIESNSMTDALPEIYRQILSEELSANSGRF